MRKSKNSSLEWKLDELTVPECPLDEAAQQRILQRATQKVEGMANAKCQPAAAPRHLQPDAPRAKRGGLSRRAASLLVAALLLGALSVTAVAVGPTVFKMISTAIGFYDEAPTQSEVSDPLDAPRGEYPATAAQARAYNAPVGQTVSCNGVDVTLDNISMDISTMDVWFSITGPQAVKGALNPDEFWPEWEQLIGAGPDFWQVSINGQEIAQRDMSDYYRVDDSTLRLWVHYLLRETPMGETVTVELTGDRQSLNVEGEWKFSVQLDGASVRSGGKTVQSGVFDTASTEPMLERQLPQSLHLERLAFGPVGGSLTADLGNMYVDGNTIQGDWCGLPGGMLSITDDTGKQLPITRDPLSGVSSMGLESYNVALPDAAATAVTLTPVLLNWQEAEAAGWTEERTVTSAQMAEGVTVETSALGGFRLQNYRVEGSTISYEAVPYGWVGGCLELIPQDEGLISYAETSVNDPDSGGQATVLKSALASRTVDPKTGVYTCRLDYYAATGEQLAQIVNWGYDYAVGYSLDSEHAVTLPLEKAG